MQLHIDDMTCGGCARAVRATILDLDAAAQIEADPPSRTVTVETTVPLAQLRSALADAGYPVSGGNL